MDDTEIKIEGIRKLKLIHIYRLPSENEAIPAIMVHYDSNKMLNLCSLDEHYSKLVAKVLQVYGLEAESENIIIDEETRIVLEAARNSGKSYYDAFETQLKERPVPLYYHQSYMVYIVMPVMKYFIAQMYEMSGKAISWTPLSAGWFGKGRLTAVAGEETLAFPYVVECKGVGKYGISVCNYMGDGKVLNMSLEYGKYGIKIIGQCDSDSMNANIEYKIDSITGEVTEHTTIVKDKKQIYNHTGVPEHIDTKIKGRFNNVIPKKINSLYALPWEQYIGITTDKHEAFGSDIYNAEIAYICSTEERNIIYVIGYDEIETKKQQFIVSVNNYAMDIYEDRIYGENIQVYFDEMGRMARGVYKQDFANRYFIGQTEQD